MRRSVFVIAAVAIAVGRAAFGTRGYGGACPPSGDKPHRYVFTVYALKVATLGLPATASGAMLGCEMNTQVLAEATLTARYGR